jgi:hypothetical protein
VQLGLTEASFTPIPEAGAGFSPHIKVARSAFRAAAGRYLNPRPNHARCRLLTGPKSTKISTKPDHPNFAFFNFNKAPQLLQSKRNIDPSQIADHPAPTC